MESFRKRIPGSVCDSPNVLLRLDSTYDLTTKINRHCERAVKKHSNSVLVSFYQ